MTDNERVFNKQYIRYGGIFLDDSSEKGKQILGDVDRIRKKINGYYKDRKALFVNLNGTTTEKSLKNITCEAGKYHPYVNLYCADASDINAFAGKADGDYYMGILKGVFLKVPNEIKDYVTDECFGNVMEIGKCMPKTILNSLTEHCLDFFTFHEFFHIMNGHCDLIKSMGISELSEDNSECTMNGLDLQTLEFDADCCAIASIINEYFRDQFMIIDSIDGMNGRPNLDSTVQFISGVLIAIYILHSLLNTQKIIPQQITDEYLQYMTHPLPGTRLLYVWATISTIITSLNIYSKEEINEISERAYNSVFSFINEFKDIAYPGFMKIAIEPVGIRHMQKLNDNWKLIREKLDVHYNELAPYEEIDFETIFEGR